MILGSILYNREKVRKNTLLGGVFSSSWFVIFAERSYYKNYSFNRTLYEVWIQPILPTKQLSNEWSLSYNSFYDIYI